MKKRNPKQEGTILYDCVPQHGPCPNDCNQCYYNICFYAGHEPLIPEPRDVAGGIVRMNSGHDSNLEKPLVLETAEMYDDVFFNTSIADLRFPGPVVLTANKNEELVSGSIVPCSGMQSNLMFVRLRTSALNMDIVLEFAREWAAYNVPVVMTLMRYRTLEDVPKCFEDCYENKLHVTHDWWVPTSLLWTRLTTKSVFRNNRLIHTCGSYDSHLCKDCGLCECYYRITKKRLEENGYHA